MENFVIAIGRQYGSRGRQIAKEIADRLGAAYYDRKLIQEAAAEFGYAKELFDKADEKRPSFLRSLLSLNYGSQNNYVADSLSSESLYRKQSDVIRRLASKEGCVFVGRTADYVLRDHPRMLSLFIHAPIERRVEEIIRRGDCADWDEAIELANKIDRSRHDYYNYYTNRSWGDADNYHLTFDSSIFTADDIVSLLLKQKILTD